ncbi:MAG: hypothetical protein M3Y33_15770, partial [Actinomycetota bacterium]|nr:hypothetical protein [Actinomycetota bacterium]
MITPAPEQPLIPEQHLTDGPAVSGEPGAIGAQRSQPPSGEQTDIIAELNPGTQPRAGGQPPAAPKTGEATDQQDQPSDATQLTQDATLAQDNSQRLAGIIGTPTIPLSWQARVFTSNDDGMAFGRRTWDETVRRLSPEQRQALAGYTDDTIAMGPGQPGYQAINPFLKGRMQATPANQERIAQIQESVARIDEALRLQPVPQDIVVNRTTNRRAFLGPDGEVIGDPAELAGLTGSVQHAPEYLSTALGAYGYGSEEIALHLMVPAGTPALYLETIAYNPNEHELLLGRGLSFHIDRVWLDETWHVQAHIIGDEAREPASAAGGSILPADPPVTGSSLDEPVVGQTDQVNRVVSPQQPSRSSEQGQLHQEQQEHAEPAREPTPLGNGGNPPGSDDSVFQAPAKPLSSPGSADAVPDGQQNGARAGKAEAEFLDSGDTGQVPNAPASWSSGVPAETPPGLRDGSPNATASTVVAPRGDVITHEATDQPLVPESPPTAVSGETPTAVEAQSTPLPSGRQPEISSALEFDIAGTAKAGETHQQDQHGMPEGSENQAAPSHQVSSGADNGPLDQGGQGNNFSDPRNFNPAAVVETARTGEPAPEQTSIGTTLNPSRSELAAGGDTGQGPGGSRDPGSSGAPVENVPALQNHGEPTAVVTSPGSHDPEPAVVPDDRWVALGTPDEVSQAPSGGAGGEPAGGEPAEGAPSLVKQYTDVQVQIGRAKRGGTPEERAARDALLKELSIDHVEAEAQARDTVVAGLQKQLEDARGKGQNDVQKLELQLKNESDRLDKHLANIQADLARRRLDVRHGDLELDYERERAQLSTETPGQAGAQRNGHADLDRPTITELTVALDQRYRDLHEQLDGMAQRRQVLLDERDRIEREVEPETGEAFAKFTADLPPIDAAADPASRIERHEKATEAYQTAERDARLRAVDRRLAELRASREQAAGDPAAEAGIDARIKYLTRIRGELADRLQPPDPNLSQVRGPSALRMLRELDTGSDRGP